MASDTKYLQKRGRIWWIYYAIPKRLKNNPRFINTTTYTASLHTDSLRRAKIARDVIIAKFDTYATDDYSAWQAAIAEQLDRFIQDNPHLDTQDARGIMLEDVLQAARERFGTNPDDGSPKQLSASDEHQIAILGNKPQTASGSLVALGIRASVGKKNAGKANATVNKINNSVRWFLATRAVSDMQITDITHDIVSDAIAASLRSCSGSTIAGYLYGLNQVYKIAKKSKLVTGDSPFDDHEFSLDKQSFDPFTKQEIYQLYQAATGPLQRLIHAAATTGARLSELHGAAVAVPNGVDYPCWHIAYRHKGKNASSTRIVPIHSSINIADYADGYGVCTSTLSTQFKELVKRVITNKNMAVSGRARKLSLHSFRTSVTTELTTVHRVAPILAKAITGHASGASLGSIETYISLDDMAMKKSLVELIVWEP
jgi:hypothetical protein